MEEQQEERQYQKWQDFGLVLPSTVGIPISPRNLNRHFKGLLEKAGLPKEVRLHDLRHSCASFLLALGVPMRVISDILGHTDPGFTAKTYTHVGVETSLGAVKQVGRLFEELLKKGEKSKE